MNSLVRRSCVAAALALMGAAGIPAAWALGFRNPDQNARATGQGEAFIAQADDASAIYYNPAGLTQVTGTEVLAGGLYTWRDIKFNGTVASEKMDDPGMLLHLYGVTTAGGEDSDWRVGVGVNIPFGLAVDYGSKGTLRFRVTEASMQVFNIQPTVAYRINDQLSVGVGLNVYVGNTRLENNFLFAAPPAPEGVFRFDGDGIAVGGTVGALWRINDQHALGAVYRSPFDLDFSGSVQINPDLVGVFGRSPAEARIQYPQSIAAGYAFRPIPALKLEVDVDWTDWDRLKDVVLRSPNLAFNQLTIPFRWRNSFYYEFGAEYDLGEHWQTRLGYIFSENSVPSKTFSPSVPDANRHVISVGAGYRAPRWSVDVTYQYSLSEDRRITGSADTNFDGAGDLDGIWKSQAHAVLVSGRWRF